MKKITKIILVLTLLIAGMILGIFCYEETFVTTILHYHDNNVYSAYSALPLTKGTVIHGRVTAAYDNFGTIKIRLNTFSRFNSAHLTFRLRKVGDSAWFVTNTYVTDRFPNGLLFPFGFAPIADSKGKSYEFELSSFDGLEADSVGIINGYHSVATQYNFQRSQLVKDKKVLISFVRAKLVSFLIDPYFYLYILMFLIPALFAIIRLGGWDRNSFLRVGIICTVYLAVVYAYLPVTMNSNVILYIGVMELGLLSILEIPSSVIFYGAIVLLIQIPLLLFLGQSLAANRIAGLELFTDIIGIVTLSRSWNGI